MGIGSVAFERLKANIIAEVTKAIDQVDQDLVSIAKTDTAPVREGKLRSSIQAETDLRIQALKGGGIGIVGGVAARVPYAMIQHEVVFNHPKGGEDHYFTGPFDQKKQTYQSFINQAVQRAIRASAEGA